MNTIRKHQCIYANVIHKINEQKIYSGNVCYAKLLNTNTEQNY